MEAGSGGGVVSLMNVEAGSGGGVGSVVGGGGGGGGVGSVVGGSGGCSVVLFFLAIAKSFWLALT